MSKPKAEATGVLKFGDVRVDCYVLDDGRRVISQRGVVRALTGGAAEQTSLGRFLDRLPNRFAHLAAPPSCEFIMPNGGIAHGREAKWFVEMCNAYVDAFFAGQLHPSQSHLAAQARAVLSACATVGIEALIDEATGYQYVREQSYLSSLFERMLREQAGSWQKTWRDDVVAVPGEPI